MSCEKITPRCVLFPVFLLSLAFTIFLSFQAWLLVSDRDSLNQAYAQQSKALEQVSKVKTQVNALAKGTLTLAKQGNKNAQGVVDQLKKAGINIQDKPQDQPPTP